MANWLSRSGSGFSFDDLLLRMHPAESRREEAGPGNAGDAVLFDLLDDGGRT